MKELDMAFTLGLDLDGVCGDYVAEFRRHVARATGVDEATLADPASWSFVDSWPNAVRDLDHYMELHSNAVKDGLFRGLQPMTGVQQALWTLSDNDVYIRIVTHRLLGKGMHQLAAADTIAWLDRHDLPYRDLCFMGEKAQVEADVYIDDAPHNILSLRASGAEAIVFDAPYNQHLEGPRAYSWDEACEMVLERQQAWKARQA